MARPDRSAGRTEGRRSEGAGRPETRDHATIGPRWRPLGSSGWHLDEQNITERPESPVEAMGGGVSRSLAGALAQVGEPAGDVEISEVVGGDLVVVFFRLRDVVLGLVDTAEAIVQRILGRLVVGVEGLERVEVIPFGELR